MKFVLYFFDTQKAFDSVPHASLLQKLADIGINHHLLKWIQRYLTGRKQFVVVEGASSPTLQVFSGVPQGSVLGPLLYIFYLNDVVHQISDDSKAKFSLMTLPYTESLGLLKIMLPYRQIWMLLVIG